MSEPTPGVEGTPAHAAEDNAVVHELKSWPESFDAIERGVKPFDVRLNDRRFKVGEVLLLREFEPCRYCKGGGRVWDNGDCTDCDCTITRNPKGVYTGAVLRRTITFVSDFKQRDGVVVLGLRA